MSEPTATTPPPVTATEPTPTDTGETLPPIVPPVTLPPTLPAKLGKPILANN